MLTGVYWSAIFFRNKMLVLPYSHRHTSKHPKIFISVQALVRCKLVEYSMKGRLTPGEVNLQIAPSIQKLYISLQFCVVVTLITKPDA